MRELASQVDGEFDVVLACDNALPHLLEDDDLRLAIANMFAKLRPGGLFLASIRDYDRLVQERPHGEGPRVVDDIAVAASPFRSGIGPTTGRPTGCISFCCGKMARRGTRITSASSTARSGHRIW